MANNIPPPPSEEALYGKGSIPPPPPEHELYSSKGTISEAPAKFYEIEKQPGLPISKEAPQSGFINATIAAGKPLLKQIGRQFMEGAKSPMPGSLLSVPIKAVSENASQAGADVARGTEHALGKPLARAAGFGVAAALDPLSYEGGGLLKGPGVAKAVAQSEMKPGVEEMLQNLKEQNAPLKGIIERETKNVMDHVENVVKKYGDELNDAKKNLGIPITNKERELAIVEHGNPQGISKNVNKLYQDMVAPPKTATDLVKNISKFKSMAADISDDSMKVRLASALQDNINKFVDWSKPGDTTEGVLKSQYKDLQQIGIPASLKASKAKMAEVLNLTETLGKKMEEPGQAEAYLRNLVTGKSARNKDGLAAIRHLEELTGTPMFDKIRKAVETEKATETAIKHFEKLKGKEATPLEQSGLSVQDLLTHKIASWRSVVDLIVKSKDQVKSIAKAAIPKVRNQALIGASRGFTMNEGNKQELDKVMSRLKNAK